MDYISGYNTMTFMCISGGIRSKSECFRWGPGMRDLYSIQYVISGKGRLIVDGNVYEICAGQSFVIFPYQNILLEADMLDPWEYKWVEFKGDDVSWYIDQTSFSRSNPVMGKMPVENFEKYFDGMDGRNEQVYERCRANAKMLELISYYIEYFPKKAANANNYAAIARAYIEKNFRNTDCTPRKVTDYLKIDRTHLFRLFKKETGMSVQEYINDCRISKACIMLLDETIAVKDVAYSVGFSDQMYFSKVFKKVMGITPTQYRISGNM